ncbi:hypothetical protein KDX30_01500 [Pseudomonas sp. CDFA 553]|uniref:hypothetical protein n=1 Tax=Pseudomonas quasicaspiana TaxID=2829821 RepID=UPI0013DF1EFC|nr:hypothetical protein [Pseudomonas quasicaspiana]MCD5986566.1 hypothetical protein [Pseudomonas quasicaspiana]
MIKGSLFLLAINSFIVSKARNVPWSLMVFAGLVENLVGAELARDKVERGLR